MSCLTPGLSRSTRIRIEGKRGVLMFYKDGTGELIYKCGNQPEEGGDIPYKDDGVEMEDCRRNCRTADI